MENILKELDSKDMYSVLCDSYKQIEYISNLGKLGYTDDYSSVNSIVIVGMGGSAIAGDFVKNLFFSFSTLPVQVIRNYNIPVHINSNTLVVVSSYSGNTEETISAMKQALQLKAKVIVISTGGMVCDLAKENNLVVVKLQSGFQPRYAFYMSIFAMLKFINDAEIITFDNSYFSKSCNLLEQLSVKYGNEQSDAYKIAEQLIGSIPLIYSCVDLTEAVGQRFKGQLNENSKMHAFYNAIPEMNHNEIVGWQGVSEDDKFKAVFILDKAYNKRIKLRFSIVKKILISSGIDVIELQSDEEDYSMRLLHLVFLCDWISFYAAILANRDPVEIKNINLLKEELLKNT